MKHLQHPCETSETRETHACNIHQNPITRCVSSSPSSPARRARHGCRCDLCARLRQQAPLPRPREAGAAPLVSSMSDNTSELSHQAAPLPVESSTLDCQRALAPGCASSRMERRPRLPASSRSSSPELSHVLNYP
jgi:hypothetical protein